MNETSNREAEPLSQRIAQASVVPQPLGRGDRYAKVKAKTVSIALSEQQVPPTKRRLPIADNPKQSCIKCARSVVASSNDPFRRQKRHRDNCPKTALS